MTSQPLRVLHFGLASFLFFLSGATGLAYQVIWFKRFSHVWGNSTLAMAAVIASFLTGLGLGASLIGRFADRARAPLFWYGISEAAIGALAILVPFGIQLLLHVAAGIYPHLESGPFVHSVARFGLTFLVLVLPCLLMGGTLPLLVKHFVRPGGAPRESTGWLYAINTLGAATGCYAAGFHLLPSFGLHNTNAMVAGLNAAIGLAAVGLQALWGVEREELAAPAADGPAADADDGSLAPEPETTPALLPLYVAVALTGAAALLLEMVWTRQLALILGGSTYAFTAMLVMVLVGIGLGSLVYHLGFRKRPGDRMVAAAVIAVLVLSTAAGKLLIPPLTVFLGTAMSLRAAQGWNAALALGASAVIELLPAMGMGLLFPMFVDMTRKRAAEAGRAIGTIYAWNTIGSILGIGVTSLILVPAIGTANTLLVAIVLYAAGLLAIVRTPRTAGECCAVLFFVLALGGAGLAVTRPDDPLVTNIGMFMYGKVDVRTKGYVERYFKEGASCNVLVTEQDKHFSLRVNGKVDASSAGDMATQTGFAYFPLFLAPQAKEVLVIGFGSGTTVGSALLFPQVQVTCCEIEPAVYEGARIFKEYNHDPHAKAEAEAPQARRLRMVFDDGRSHLQGTDKRYDVILSEPSNPWLAGISNLFTREFYQAVKPKLAPGGVLAQWIQSYSFTSRDYAMVVRTLLEVFPECALIRITSGDTMLVAGSQPFFPSAATLDLGQAIIDTQPALKDDLLKYYGITDLRSFLLVHWILDRDGLVRLANSIQPPTINTDRNMKLEFDAPLRLFDETDSRVEVMKPILAAADLKWFEKAAAAWGSSPVQAAAIKRLLEVFDRKAHADLFRGLVAIGLRLDPEHLDLLADKLSLSGEIGEAELQAAIEKALATSAKDANRLGVLLFKGGQHERALAVFSRMLASHPYSVNTLQNMAVAYDAWGKTDDAAATFEKALELDPMNETTRKSYANFAEKLRRQAAKNAAGDGPAGPLPEGSAPPEAKAAAEHEGGKEP